MKHLYSSRIVLVILLFCTSNIFSQEEKPHLPNGLTETEKSLISQFQFRNTSQITPPPSSPVRAAAEWEEVEYLLVTWTGGYTNILRQIVAAGVNECKVIIATQNQASVASYLTANGVDLTNVIFMNAPWDSIWVRDYGGNTIYSNDVGELALTDWIYNRPRPLDNVMPSAHAAQVGIPIYVTDSGMNDLVNTGGNYMSDGLGNAFASELILEDNAVGNPFSVTPKTAAQIDEIMFNYMGIDNYIKMPTLPYDGIHHIDMHMKLLDEETLLVSRYPADVADGPQIEANINYILANYQSAFGTPYKIERIDSPPSTTGAYPDTGGAYRTFSNAVIVNKTVMIPLYRPEVDAAAIAKYQELMPGYNIVGIDVDNSGENLINSSGAIHCITHTIGVAQPLWIVHQPIAEANVGSTVTINAMIKHITGIAQAKVFWREQGTTTFNETNMSFVSNDNYAADILIPTNGNDVEYYIWAQAVSGKSLARPIVAPDGFWTIVTQSLSAQEWASTHISAPYPNPAHDSVTFNLFQLNDKINVTITNVLGQMLFDDKISNGNGSATLKLNPEWKGTLFITFHGDFGQVTKKIIKL